MVPAGVGKRVLKMTARSAACIGTNPTGPGRMRSRGFLLNPRNRSPKHPTYVRNEWQRLVDDSKRTVASTSEHAGRSRRQSLPTTPDKRRTKIDSVPVRVLSGTQTAGHMALRTLVQDRYQFTPEFRPGRPLKATATPLPPATRPRHICSPA